MASMPAGSASSEYQIDIINDLLWQCCLSQRYMAGPWAVWQRWAVLTVAMSVLQHKQLPCSFWTIEKTLSRRRPDFRARNWKGGMN